MPFMQDPGSRLLPLKTVSENRGVLVAVENGPDLPFSIQRLFFILKTGSAPRGFHAHRRLHELLICVAGSCHVVIDNGSTREDYHLARPDQGLHVAPMEWVEMSSFSDDCVLLVLASTPYDEADYIRDYPAFLAACGKAPLE